MNVKVKSVISALRRAGFTIEETRPGAFCASKSEYPKAGINFYRNGGGSEYIGGALYIHAPGYFDGGPYPSSIKAAIKWFDDLGYVRKCREQAEQNTQAVSFTLA